MPAQSTLAMREISLFWRVAIVFYLDDGGEERAKRGEEDTGQLQHVSVLPDDVPATNNLYRFLCTSLLISNVHYYLNLLNQ